MYHNPNNELCTIQKEILVKLITTDHELKNERKELERNYPGWISKPNFENDATLSLCVNLLRKSARNSIVDLVIKSSWEKREITYSDIEKACTVWNDFKLREIVERLHDKTFKDFCNRKNVRIDISGSEYTIRTLAGKSKRDPEILNGSIWYRNTIRDGTHRCLALTLVLLESRNLLPVMGFFSVDSIKP